MNIALPAKHHIHSTAVQVIRHCQHGCHIKILHPCVSKCMRGNVFNCMNTCKNIVFYSLKSELDIYFLSWEVMADSGTQNWARLCYWKAQGDSSESKELQLPSEAARRFAGGSLNYRNLCQEKKPLFSHGNDNKVNRSKQILWNIPQTFLQGSYIVRLKNCSMPFFFFLKDLLVRSNPKPNCFQYKMDHFLAYFLFSDLNFSVLVLFQRAKHAYKRKGGILTFFWNVC